MFSPAERHVRGVGENVTKESILKREVIHRLFISPLSHSEIVKQLKVSQKILPFRSTSSLTQVKILSITILEKHVDGALVILPACMQ